MTRRVVFAGGVQAKALAKAYRLDAALDRDEDVFFIGAESMAREAAHRVIAAADIVVTDMTEAGETVPESLVPARAELIGVPVVSGAFLWPFAGQPHPRNQGTDALPEGPYPAGFGDSHLDALMAEGVPADEAVARYLDLDIAAAVDLDALLEATLSAQAALDARSGFDLADFVGQRFRTQNLFATADRMRLALFQHVASRVFGQMGAEPARANALLETHFPPGAMPIHPGVLRHFGMDAPLPDHRYPVLDEGLFTFAQYCHRYVNLTWNPRLHAAMALAETDPYEAIPALRAALEESPGSQAGQLALERAERATAQLSRQPPLALSAPGQHEAEGAAPAAPPQAPPPTPSQAPPRMPWATPALPAGLSWPTAADAQVRLSGGLAPPARPAAAPAPDPIDVPEQQSYVELPQTYAAYDPAPAPAAQPTPGRYTPLAPAQDLIEVLPRMLPSTQNLAGSADGPFATMLEAMPPPPLRPVLPPEFQAEPKRGLMARLFGGAK